MHLWIWRHFRIELPEDWEMLQFARNEIVGRCAFADRYQFRLELSWRKMDSKPDMIRLLDDYQGRLRQQSQNVETDRIRSGKWSGIDSRTDNLISSRFGSFFEGESCLVEIVFLWPEAKDGSLIKSVLATFGEEPAERLRLRRWKAFGMDLLASEGLPLVECMLEPARAKMVFADEKQTQLETFERLGMVSQWLDVPLADWLEMQSPKDTRIDNKECRSLQSHEIEVVDGTVKGRSSLPLTGKRFHYNAEAWICPKDGRLYCARSLEAGPAKRLFGKRLTCCGELTEDE